MDIAGNLFYNENTVHSGSFLEELTGFGKETMRGKIRTYYTDRKRDNRTDTGQIVRCTSFVFALFICSVLCGCTRREQLVLETGDTPQEAQYEASNVPGSDEEMVQHREMSDTQMDKTAAGDGAASAAMPEGQEQMQPVGAEQKAEPDQSSSVIYVHVCGAVKNPGVYELSAGSRVFEAVEEAGGFTENADSSYVNQAQKLADGAKLIIPTMEQAEAMSEADTAGAIGIVGAMASEQAGTGWEISGSTETVPDGSTALDGKININTASEAELCNIPGIGATRAAAIVAYRQERGGFTSIEDIMNVSGIKEGTYDKIKDRIKVN